MQSLVKHSLFLLLCLSSWIACQPEEPYLNIDTDSIRFAREGGTAQVNISTNTAWTAIVTGEGFTSDPSSGCGDAVITLRAAVNEDTDPVTGSLTLRSTSLAASISIIQAATNALVLSADQSIGPEGGVVVFTVQHNIAFQYSVEASASDWIVPVCGKSLTRTEVPFIVKANDSYSERTGNIVFTDDTGILPPQTARITQWQNNAILLSENQIHLPCEASDFTVTVRHNVDFSLVVDAPWIERLETKGLDETVCRFAVSENSATEPRTGHICFLSQTLGLADTLTVTQDPVSALIVQRNALLALYEAADGDHWTPHEGWNKAVPLGQWEGVGLSRDSVVTRLNLHGFGLNGPLSDQIGLLDGLTRLDLSENPGLKGSLPASMGNLTEMDTFLCVNTGLSGTLPETLGAWTKVRNFQLNNNKIEGEIPATWSAMASLEDFGLHGTRISGIPANLFACWKHIGSIALNDNPCLTGELPSSIGNIVTDNTRLNLHLQNCNFTGGIPANWANIPEVSSQLRLYGNRLTEKVPYVIQSHPNWTPDKWDCGDPDGKPLHYIRSQQNDVYLDLEPCGGGYSQRELLMMLYKALDGPNWSAQKGWNTQTPIDRWEGVTVSNQMVTGLSLKGIGLNGELPASIGHLNALLRLELSSNPKLSGPLPEELGQLLHIREFLANDTGLSGPLPAVLGGWNAVTRIELDHNTLSGSIPAEWSGMEALRELSLCGTRISGIAADVFTAWKHLRLLQLGDNPLLSGALPPELGSLRTDSDSLHINLSACNFTGGIPETYACLPQNCDRLWLYGNRLTEAVPLSIQKHPCWRSGAWDSGAPDGNPLHYIRSQQNGVYLALVPDPADLQRRALIAIYEALDGPRWKRQTNWNSAEDINTWEGVTTDGAGRVTALHLNNNNLSGTLPRALGELDALTVLDLGSNPGLTTPIPETLFTAWTHLRVLDFSHNSRFTGALPRALGELTTDQASLSLRLHACNFDGGIPDNWGHLPEVTAELLLYGNRLTEKVPLAVQNHPRWADNTWNPAVNILPQQDGVVLELEKESPYADEKEILTAIYKALDGPNWTKQENWLTNDDISTWQGVKVKNGHVTKLDISNRGIKGDFPEAICYLVHLDTLYIGASPELTGSLPEALGNLTEMICFNMVRTGLSGTWPKGIGKWSKAVNLQMSSNTIGGPIPAEWAGLVSLRNIGMFGTRLASPFPDEIFTAWKHVASILWNKNPCLTGELPALLGTMTTDQERFNVHLHECNFTGGIPRSYGSLPSVSKQIFLNANKLTEPVPIEMQRHPSWSPDIWNPDVRIRPQQNNITLELETPSR